MAPLIFLLAAFGILWLADRFILNNRLGLSFVGRAAMAVMLTVTGASHFTNPGPMVEMMPEFVPAKLELVYFTGVCELLAVIGLVWNRFSRLASVMLIIFFLAILPANIAGSIKAVNFGGMEYGSWYLLFRVPLQIFFIWWVWFFGISVRRTVSPTSTG